MSLIQKRTCSCLSLFAILFLILPNSASSQPPPQPRDENLSVRLEVQRAIDRGLSWLEKNQNADGTWSTGDQAALTALPLLAFKGEPSGRYSKDEPEFIKRGYSFLEQCAQPDGSIYKKKELLTHNTALSVLAFTAAKDEKYNSIIRKGREFLIGLQTDFGVKGETDNVFDGGLGYGPKYEHSDMANTLAALEAIYYSREHLKDTKAEASKELDWAAAIEFLQNCQNLPSHNKQDWASDDLENKGGFVYYPGHSMAGETNISGRVTLRSYGSASYAGLLSYIYTDLKRDDPRVQAVYKWLQQNYTLEENPGMGPQGLYYYFHTMAKALSALDVNEIKTADGKEVNWRHDLAMKLIDLQNADGSWMNDNGRWWEKDPALVTAYSIIALERIYRGL
ncbi:MAG: terpene cyclase/mutase family protein [Verrucomicrobia bacterium]|nr:terpene cyclase/mutase family protein [Verrucomicrobiota bacterium]